MNSVEDRLRAATHAAAQTVAPGSAPPLRLPNRQPGRLRSLGRPPQPGRRWRRLAIPLAAAAAVTAVVASSVSIGHQQRPTVSQAEAAVLAKLPPYFLTTGQVGNARHAWIAATATGKHVAQVPVPAGNFVAVTAGSGSGEYVLVTVPDSRLSGFPIPAQQIQVLLVRFDPASKTVTEKPVTGLLDALHRAGSQSQVANFALSPDGRMLAVSLSVTGSDRTSTGSRVGLMTYNLVTGGSRTWYWPTDHNLYAGSMGRPILSWAADDQILAFGMELSDLQVWRLDTHAPGSDLKAASRLAAAWKETYSFAALQRPVTLSGGGQGLLSPDGSRIVLPTTVETVRVVHGAWRPVRVQEEFTEYSATSGKPVSALGRWYLKGVPEIHPEVLWASPSGSTLIVLSRVPGTHISYPKPQPDSEPPPPGQRPFDANWATYHPSFAVVTGGKVIRLPIPAGDFSTHIPTGIACYPVW